MDLTERSRRRVDAAVDRLDDRFGVERVVETRWAVSAEEYERTVERFEAGTLGGAGAWVADDEGRVLLVREAGRDGWSDPSGKHEPGETLAETARREVAEETGLSVDLERVELAQVAVHVLDEPTDDALDSNLGGSRRAATDSDRPPVVRLVVVFGARRTGGTARAREPGIEAVEWFEEHPDDLLYDALADLPIHVEQ